MWTVISVLILIGLLMMIMEVLVIPGSGFAGLIGIVLMAAGVWLAYSKEGIMAGHITLASTLAINLLGLIIILRSKTWKKASLKAVNTEKDNYFVSFKLRILLIPLRATPIVMFLSDSSFLRALLKSVVFSTGMRPIE